MTSYINKSGDSGISKYKIGGNYIDIKFKGSYRIYRYHESKISSAHLERMKQLAVEGSGLGTYINQNPIIRDNCEKL